MKRILFICSMLFLATNIFSQAPVIEWQKSYGGEFDDNGKCIKQTSDGGYIVVGYSLSNNGYVTGNHGATDIWVVKLSSTGIVQWQKSLGGSMSEQSYSIGTTADGGYIIAGIATSTDGDITNANCNGDFWLIKLNSLGAIVWQNVYGGTFVETAYSVVGTSDGGFIVAGSSASNDGPVTGAHGGMDYWIVKYNSSGIPQWQKNVGSINGHDEAYSIKQTSDGGYIVAGVTYATAGSSGDVTGCHGSGDYWIVKLSSTGSLTWQKAFGGSYIDTATDVIQTADGGYLVIGSSESSNGDVVGHKNRSDYWILKLDSAGTLQWQKIFGGTWNDIPRCIKKTPDGNYVIVGSTSSLDGDVVGSEGSGDYVFWLMKITPSGNLLWQKPMGKYGASYGYSVEVTSDGGFVIAGQTSDSQYFYNPPVSQSLINYHVIKLGPDTLSTPSNKNNTLSIYPNPVSNQVNIQLSGNTTIDKIVISDMLGKTIIELEENNTTIDTNSLTKGIYLIQVVAGKNNYTSKFIKE